MYLVGATTVGAFTHVVLNVLVLQFVQALRLFARSFVSDAPRPARDLARELALPPAFAARAAFAAAGAAGGDAPAPKGAALFAFAPPLTGSAPFSAASMPDGSAGAPRLTPLLV